MNTYGTSLLKMAREWFQDEGFQLLPYSLDHFEYLYSTDKQTVHPGYETNPESDENIFLPGCCIPLLAAILENAPPPFLKMIAGHHGVDNHLSSLTDAFSGCNAQVLLSSGDQISTTELAVKCLHAVEDVDQDALTRAYHESDENGMSVTVALMSAKSRKQWPVEILRQYQNAMDKGLTPEHPLEVLKHNFLDILEPKDYPADWSGVRYDWLLERSGMLLPGVIKKSLGAFSAWEEFAWIGSPKSDGIIQQGFIDYCVDVAPAKHRPLIKQGLLSMVLESSHIADGAPLLEWMKERFANTYLGNVVGSIVLQTNMIRSETPADRATTDSPQAFAGLTQSKETILASLCDEILHVPVSQMGQAHFISMSFLERNDFSAPAQVLGQGFNREAFLCHVLNGLNAFIPASNLVSEQQQENLEKATAGITSLVKQFTPFGEFNYDAFRRLDSRSASLLAMAGLDLKRLPVMTNRDKGRVLEQDLGM